MTVATLDPGLDRRRRRSCVLVFLICASCDYRERWPLPVGVHVRGRCTCPSCGGQLHEDLEAPAIDTGRLR